jgi:hypothetical protein
VKLPLRLVVAFFAAYGLNIALHECAHALMAHLLGLPATLFHFYVDIDYPNGDPRARILCAVAGPLFSLGLGVLFWALYLKFQESKGGLLLLYFSILGTSMFLGNLFSTSFVGGDLGVAAAQLNLPASMRLAMTLAGGLLLAGFLYRMGPELLKWTSPEPTRLGTAMHVIVWPVVVGTALVILAFLPMPAAFIIDWIASSSFWVFAAVSVVVSRNPAATARSRDLPVQPIELAAAAAMVLIVRELARGIHWMP